MSLLITNLCNVHNIDKLYFDMINIETYDFSEVEQYLNSYDLENINKVNKENDKNHDKRKIMANIILQKKYIKKMENVDYEKIIINRTKYNKSPYYKKLKYNISQDGKFVAIVGSLNESHIQNIGINIMEKTQSDDFLILEDSFMSNTFNQNEIFYINEGGSKNNKINRFLKCWCIKESILKAVGIKLYFEPLQITIRYDSEKKSVDCASLNISSGNLYVSENDEYVLSICTLCK